MLPHITDQHYLSTTQYDDAANLNARIRLHQRFSTNPHPVHRWFFEQLTEIRRVLRPNGALYAMTFGRNHLLELRQWVNDFGPDTMLMSPEDTSGAFDLELGRQELAQHFGDVQVSYYPDSLVITELAPLLDYVRSTVKRLPFPGDKGQAFVAFLQERLTSEGSLTVQKMRGLLTAS